MAHDGIESAPTEARPAGTGERIGVGDEVLSADLATEQADAAIDLAPSAETTDTVRPETVEPDGALYSKRYESVLLQRPQSGPATFRQQTNRDVIGTLGVYGNESLPVLNDGGKLAHASAGLLSSRVRQLSQEKVLRTDEEVTVWVVDGHGVHAKIFLDTLRHSDPTTYERTRVVLVNHSEEVLQTIQDRNVLDGHGHVQYRAATSLTTLRASDRAPMMVIAPDLPNRQEGVYQIFQDTSEPDSDTSPKEFELQFGVKAIGDSPLLTIDPESGLTDIAVLDNLFQLGTAQSADGRRLIQRLGNRLDEPARDVAIDDTQLRRNGRSVHHALAGTEDHQLYNFTPPRSNPIRSLIEQLRPHGMLLTSGYLNNGSKLSPERVRQVNGSVTTYVAELGALHQQADSAQVEFMKGSAVLPKDGDYGYLLFDVSSSPRLTESTNDQFVGEAGVRAPDHSEQFLHDLVRLAPAAIVEGADGHRLYNGLLTRYPGLAGNYDLAVTAASRLNQQGHHNLAASVAETAIQYAPHVCTSALLEAGRAYVALGQNTEAAQRFNWALEISPNAPSVHHELMRLYSAHHDWDRYIVAAGRYLRDERGLSTEGTIDIMKAIVTAAQRKKRDSAEDPFHAKTVIVESVWIDDSGEAQVERQIRYLPRWLMASIKAADLAANYADTVRRLLDYEDDMVKEDKVAIVEWFNQRYEDLCLRQDPDDLDSFAGERELWPDRTIRALWPDLATDRTHRLIYTGESTLADDEFASPQPLLNLMSREQQAAPDDSTEEVERDEQLRTQAAHIELGLIPDSMGRPRPSTLYATLDILNRHALIVGESGSGKSNFCRNMLEELSVANIPWLVIEATKSEYGAMAGRLEARARSLGITRDESGALPSNFEVTVIKPGAADSLKAIPASLNFLAPEPGFPILSHIDMVKDSLLAAFQGDEPFPQVMSQALVKVYEKHGWDMTTGFAAPGGREPTIPTLDDLIDTAMEIIDGVGYERNKEDVKGFVRMRIQSLGVGSLGKFLEGSNSFDFADLQSRNVVLNFERMGDDKMKTFLTAMFLSKRQQNLQIRDERRRQARSELGDEAEEATHRLAHFTLIEEAARLLRRSANPATDSAVSKIASSFADVRAFGEGIAAVCPNIEGLHEDVQRNTALKVAFRTPHGDDQETLATLMNMDLARASRLSGLKQGQAYVYRSGDNSGPVPIFTTYRGSYEREIPNRTPPPIRGRRAPIRQAVEADIHEAEIAIGAKTPEGAWMRSWIEFMTMAYVAGKRLPTVPEPLKKHMASLSPIQRQLQLHHSAGKAVARRTSEIKTFDPKRLQASIASAASIMVEAGVGAGTLPPREFVVPQLKVLAEDIVVHRPFYRGPKPDPEDTAPPLQHHIPKLTEPRGRRATFAERADEIGRHPLSMRHPNQVVRDRNARIGYVALFGADGARQLFDEDLALATGEATVKEQELALTRALGIGGGTGIVGWGLEAFSLPKRVFHKQLPPKSKASSGKS
jgi:tetratricopeptide (TPR) repeat protein